MTEARGPRAHKTMAMSTEKALPSTAANDCHRLWHLGCFALGVLLSRAGRRVCPRPSAVFCVVSRVLPSQTMVSKAAQASTTSMIASTEADVALFVFGMAISVYPDMRVEATLKLPTASQSGLGVLVSYFRGLSPRFSHWRLAMAMAQPVWN